ncbi:MAG: peptidoglycan DD-metalloendopeptidase family protein [Anaerolineae bacterium]|nr:peptidoglycan DD-metalloendopeptidase family protein [Anaerolineae bacterium]
MFDNFPPENTKMPDKNPAAAPPMQNQPESSAGSPKKSRFTLPASVVQFGPKFLLVAVITIAALAMRGLFANTAPATVEDIHATAAVINAPKIEALKNADGGSGGGYPPVPYLPLYTVPTSLIADSIPRYAQLLTIIPTRSRVDVIYYEVVQGDNLFSIAERFGISPETVLWGNSGLLQDNPRLITPGMVLVILPTDGVYHRWSIGENLRKVAESFSADPQAIIEWPGNGLDPYEATPDTADFPDGTWVIIPGGRRELVDWGPPAISRENPAVAAYYGSGACGQVYEGAIGNGTFVWPTTSGQISGYYYDPDLHPGLDIGGAEGNAIFATDGGVVVYAGWSEHGYGYLIVIDHGTGWQSAYAHLSGVGVICGQSVTQGTVIGALGNSGNSTGAHLHFELTSSIYGKVDPLYYMSPP